MKPEYLLLHHDADSSPDPHFQKVNANHKNRGFPKSSLGFHVGYTWFCGKDGTLKQARAEDEVGAHCSAKGMNFKSIGVCLAGNFTKEAPTAYQIESLTVLLDQLQQRWGIPDDKILLHREVGKTACPGVDLRALYFAQRVQLLRKKLLMAESALRHANGPRRNALTRKVDRLKRKIADV